MMKRKRIVKNMVVHVSLSVLLLGGVACQKTEPQHGAAKTGGKKATASTSDRLSNELEERLRELQQMRLEAEQLLRSTREKEEQLTLREAQLDSMQDALEARADMLADKEHTLDNIRVLSYFISLIGGILAIVGIVLITKSREAGKAKPSPEKKAGDLAKTTDTVDAKAKETKPAESKSTREATKAGTSEEKKTPTRSRRTGGSRKPAKNE
jgi:hypothetical protein